VVGPDTVYSWGDAPDPNRANYYNSAIGHASAVGCFPANGFGLHDMIGNVSEWTRSLWGKHFDEPDFASPYDPDDRKREDLDAVDEVRRRVEQQCQQRPLRLPQQDSPRQPEQQHRISGGSAHVFRSFFWSSRRARRRAGTPVPLAFRKCRPIRASGFARRGEGRRTARVGRNAEGGFAE
jgi:formylglycine-generating enzyme required for sulfatase activity